MSKYKIALAQSAAKEFRSLPETIKQKARAIIDKLQFNQRPEGYKKLKGSTDLFRIRLGQYRIIYKIDDNKREIKITRVRHRKDAYL